MNKPFKKLLYFPVTKIILSTAICFAMLVGVQNFISKPVFYAIIPAKYIADTMVNYVSVAVLLVSYFYVFRVYEKREIKELSTKKLPAELFGGFIFGFSVLSVVMLILYVLGYYSIISISNFSYLLAPFSLLVVAALIEEIFDRLIIYRILEDWMGTYWALLLMSILFMIEHLANDNISVLSIFLILSFGFAHGTMYLYTKRLWLPFAFHLGWNFAQPFYGSNLSGIEDIGTIIKASYEGPELLIGSRFGIEDSVLSILFISIIGIVFLQLSRKEGKIIRRKKSHSKSI
ncbi:CPBP family intramembrane metalloprotease [Flavitalea sp. BT771]|uniref:CPBP family intramembrane glutamic endopeptidase n=1 Tax=Flavitalea sp. BT771 TaxID=3063329 RepID=UPI0026E40ECF|nr:CPBP family intramembrane glutamic endopeptidase [Flavitalea sp. BT771]MDO6433501.1 CPBP family intramembrane metalloprotease [Flavitalea sp. BT771]MDV6222594.1 CPBP family intramembrane glutamic endopeptidase [Flavitalea sp. BT771]